MLLELPWPPTANTYWRFATIRGRKLVLLSALARRYRDEVAGCVDSSMPLDSRLEVRIELRAPNARKYDIDNRVKPLLDALEHAGVFLNDEQIDQLWIRRGPLDRPYGSVIVEIQDTEGSV